MAYKLDETAKGVFVISATPFDDDGSLDLESTDRLMDFYLDKGVRGITILGMMGEAPKLSVEESHAFVYRVLARVAGRVPVVVGVSHAGLDNLTSLAHVSMAGGAAGVMVAPTPGIRHEEQLTGWFHGVCGALGPDVPICFQDYPQVTGVHVSVGTLVALITDCPQVVMLKHEDCPGLRKLSELRRRSEEQKLRRLSVLCGNGGLYLPLELGRGADGAMTGFAYPEMLVQVCQRYDAGEARGAEDLYDAFLPLVRYEQQPAFGLAVRKEILRRRGAIASACTRRPGPELDAEDRDELDRLIDRMQRRLEAAK